MMAFRCHLKILSIFATRGLIAVQILVVGSNLVGEKALGKVAKKCGHSLKSVDSGASALKVSKNKQIDLIFLDTSLPDMKGYALIGEIKKIAPQSKIIVAAESNFSELESADKDEKIDYYLIKPFDEDYLENILNYISKQSV
jgi:CheY-like chemotaxis protein